MIAYKNKLNIILVSLFVIVSIYITRNQFYDPFLLQMLSFVDLNLNASQIFPVTGDINYVQNFASQEFRPFNSMIILILGKMLGVESTKAIMFLPLGLFYSFIFYAVLSNKLYQHTIISTFVLLYMLIDIGMFIGTYSIYAAAWATPLFILSIYLILKLIDTYQTKEQYGTYVLISILVFSSTSLYYYRTATWLILMYLSFSGIIILYNKFNKIKYKSFMQINLVFIIIFLTFNKIFYTSLITMNTLSGDIFYFLTRLIDSIFGNTASFSDEFTYINPFREWFLLTYLNLILFSIILVYSIAIDVINIKNKQGLNFTSDFFLKYGLFGTVFLDFVINLRLGTISGLGIMFIVWPLLAFKVLDQKLDIKLPSVNWKIIISSLIVILIVSQGARIVIFNESHGLGFQPHSKIEDFNYVERWYFSHTSESNKLYSDFHSIQKFWHYSSSVNKSFNKNYAYTSEFHSALINNQSTRNDLFKYNTDYYLIDKKSADNNSALLGGEWIYFKPLNNYYDLINNNVNLNKVYDDNYAWLFHT